MTSEALSEELYRALLERRTVPPLRSRGVDLGIDDAYAISLGILARRQARGERVIGKKIGVTSKAVQDMLGVHQPDFGFLTDAMQIADGAVIDISRRMIQPRAVSKKTIHERRVCSRCARSTVSRPVPLVSPR